MLQRFVETRQQANYFEFVHFKPGSHSLYWPRKNVCSLKNKKKIYVGINALIGGIANYNIKNIANKFINPAEVSN